SLKQAKQHSLTDEEPEPAPEPAPAEVPAPAEASGPVSAPGPAENAAPAAPAVHANAVTVEPATVSTGTSGAGSGAPSGQNDVAQHGRSGAEAGQNDVAHRGRSGAEAGQNDVAHSGRSGAEAAAASSDLLEPSLSPDEESLESIVQDMKRELER